MQALLVELELLMRSWSDLVERRVEILAADPLADVWVWQRGLGWPALVGSFKQVRWAERIRFEAASAGLVSDDMLAEEVSAAVWIGMETAGGVSVESWRALQRRAMDRQGWERRRCRCYHGCVC